MGSLGVVERSLKSLLVDAAVACDILVWATVDGICWLVFTDAARKRASSLGLAPGRIGTVLTGVPASEPYGLGPDA